MGSAFSFLLKPNKPIYFAILTMHNYMGSCIVVNSERVHKLLNPCLASACEWINISHAFTNLTLVSFLYFWHSITAAITISSTSEHGNYQQTFHALAIMLSNRNAMLSGNFLCCKERRQF